MTRRIVIAGGGPVGLALACACEGFETRVIESTAARKGPWAEEFDVRVYAVSPGTRDLMRSIGAWDRLDMRRIAPVQRMEVFDDAGARLAFAARAGTALAWIVEAGRLSDAIESEATSLPRISLSRGVQAVSFGATEGSAWAELADGSRIEGDLLVGADGPDSRVRSMLQIPCEEHPYPEAAIVANFATEIEHAGIARQWFREDGVLAWLPLPGSRISIVWSTPLAHADQLEALEPRVLEERVSDAGCATLGKLKLISKVARFPLRSIRVPRPVAPGVALVGDAAHAVHPLAGQGVNLGFQDAHVLAQTLAGLSPLERPGDLRVLRRYARARSEDVTAMQFVTDGLDRLFAARAAPVRAARSLGLRIVDAQPWAKGVLARRAMR